MYSYKYYSAKAEFIDFVSLVQTHISVLEKAVSSSEHMDDSFRYLRYDLKHVQLHFERVVPKLKGILDSMCEEERNFASQMELNRLYNIFMECKFKAEREIYSEIYHLREWVIRDASQEEDVWEVLRFYGSIYEYETYYERFVTRGLVEDEFKLSIVRGYGIEEIRGYRDFRNFRDLLDKDIKSRRHYDILFKLYPSCRSSYFKSPSWTYMDEYRDIVLAEDECLKNPRRVKDEFYALKSLKEEKYSLEKHFVDVQSRATNLMDENASLRAECEKLKHAYEKDGLEQRNLEAKLAHLERKNQALQEECEMLKSKSNEQPVLEDEVNSSQPEPVLPVAENSLDSRVYLPESRRSFFDFLKRGKTACSSVYAPSGVRRNEDFLVHVYVYREKERELVKNDAQNIDEKSSEVSYTPMNFKLKKGDRIDITMQTDGIEIKENCKSFIWNECFTKRSFLVSVPADYAKTNIVGKASVAVNGAELGEMMFTIKVVSKPVKSSSAAVEVNQYRKIFISYSHRDESKVKYLAAVYQSQGTECFFDRDYLKAGDIFPEVIKDFISTADLFVLCWSANAKASNYVEKERQMALSRVTPEALFKKKSKLSIHTLSFMPKADPPDDMKDNYHFKQIK